MESFCSNAALAGEFSSGSRPPAMLKSRGIKDDSIILPGLEFRNN